MNNHPIPHQRTSEYRYCGASITLPGGCPSACARRAGHQGPCSTHHDTSTTGRSTP